MAASIRNKIVIVTGASAGIGAEVARRLVIAGANVVGLARRLERLESLKKELEGQNGKLHVFKADVTVEQDIIDAFNWATSKVGPLNFLINNAGVISNTSLVDGDAKKWKLILDTNVLGVAIASREAIKIMKANHIDGHIININSIGGHSVYDLPGRSLYFASKFALTALTETLRLELIREGSKIKVTSVSPGVVDTEIIEANDLPQRPQWLTSLRSEDVAEAVEYILRTPPHVQVTELIIRPVGESISANAAQSK